MSGGEEFQVTILAVYKFSSAGTFGVRAARLNDVGLLRPTNINVASSIVLTKI